MRKAYFGSFYLVKNTYLLVIARKNRKLYKKIKFELILHQFRLSY